MEGDMGMGKTRLLQAFADKCATMNIPALHMCAESVEASSAFHVIKDFLVRHLNLAEGGAADRQAKLSSFLLSISHSPSSLPLLSDLFNLKLPHGQWRMCACVCVRVCVCVVCAYMSACAKLED